MSILHVFGISVVFSEFIIAGEVMEYYEEILSHIYVLTTHEISPAMWRVFDIIYEMFNKDGYDYFTGRYLNNTSPIIHSSRVNL